MPDTGDVRAWSVVDVRVGSLAEFLATSPLRDSELSVARVDAHTRDVSL
jgi:hypothetical protein